MANHHAEAFRAFLQGLNKSQHTIKQYVNDAKQFEKFLDEELYRSDFSAGLKAYIHHLHTKYNTANSINRKLAAMRSYLEFLYSRKYIKAYDETLLEPAAKQLPKLSALTDKELNSVLNCWHQMYKIAETDENAWLAMRNLAITYTIAMLGIKPAELVKMRWSHLNEVEMTIKIMERMTYRTLELPSDLLAVLYQYKQETEMFFPQLEAVDEMWLGVGNKLGEPITVKTVERVFLQLSKLLGLKVTCTNLRYTVIETYMKQQKDEELFAKFGYARKGVLIERHKRLLKEEQ